MMRCFVIRFFAVLCVMAACADGTLACTCGPSARGQNAWEDAKEFAQGSLIIFEGTPVHFDLKWDLLTAKVGEFVPIHTFLAVEVQREPEMVVTFRVERAYKGNSGSELLVNTGLGGGDCGATYQTGLDYLVYASGTSPDQFSVSMCSPGGWMGDRAVGANLRYLRHELPIPEDLRTTRPWWTRPNATQIQEQWKRDAQERQRLYAAATGRICGTIVGLQQGLRGSIAFLSTQGYSPVANIGGGINDDGSFCSSNLGPGSYYLYYVRRSESAEALYYPGVTDAAKATAVAVGAGQTASGIVFRIGQHGSYSVRGLVSTDQKISSSAAVGPNVTIRLIRSDGDMRVWYSERATFIFPRLGYFKFENVVPGRYYALVQPDEPGWMTRKTEVNVTNHMRFISLELVRKK